MEVVAGAMVGEVVRNLITLLQTNFNLITGVKKDVEKLTSILSAIQAVLEDAEATQFKDKMITDWLRKLKVATYDTEDVLDAWLSETQERERQVTDIGCTKQVSHSVSNCLDLNHVLFRRRIASKLKNIIARFDEIANERLKFHLKTSDVVRTEEEFMRKRESSSVLTEPKIYGRDDDKMKIIDMLLNVNCGEDISVVVVVGFGGVGKTALAQLVYNNEKVISWFDVRIWISVSDPFDLKNIFRQILESLGGPNLQSLQSLQNKVSELLNGKKFLLVLDDVWNEDRHEWNRLTSSLKGGVLGSSVMVTTRSGKVASITCTSAPYLLGVLSDEDCWSLLKYHAFGDRGEEDYPNLVPIGMEIVKKCKGLPLAAKSLGSLLESKTEENQWARVRDSEIWKLEGGGNTILPALRLSYNHLPPCLKQCFAYCSIFPKDVMMEKAKLILLWMANGFIQSHQGIEMEETGDSIFNELVRLSFFQDITKDVYGNIQTCKMHDLMHDLACFIVVHECSITKIGQLNSVVKTVKHLTVVPDSPESSQILHPVVRIPSSLRTLFFLEPISFDRFKFSTTLRVLNLRHMSLTTLPLSICQLKYLRYLDLSKNFLAMLPESFCRLTNLQMLDLCDNTEMTTLPLSIGNLENLRYLNLSQTSITSLPESIPGLRNLQMLDLSRNRQITTLPFSIGYMMSLKYLNLSACQRITSIPESVCGLRNLQSLILSDCVQLGALPKNMRNMTSLIHLDLHSCTGLTGMPIGIGELTRLQTLNLFVVGVDSGCGSIRELNGLNQLRGKLKINEFQNIRNAEDAIEANLRSKPYLTELSLSGRPPISQQENNHKKLLEGLQLPPNIQMWMIDQYRGETDFPQGYFENLTALTALEFHWCEELVSLPEGILRKLNTLQSLHIRSCKSIKCLPVMGIQGVKNSFVSLTVYGCANLTSVSEGLQYLSSLEFLMINECPKLGALPNFQHLTSLRELHLYTLPLLGALPDGIHCLTMLRTLRIWRCNSLKQLPGLNISLVELKIWKCPNITSLSKGLENLTSLQSLEILGCTELELKTEDFQHLNSLRVLELQELPKLRALPEGIQHLTMLQKLEIWNCQYLTRLPEGIRHLTTLQSLSVGGCHVDLHLRYEKEKGEEWHFISHIPNITIR